ncbi:M1 family metallopeptidase [Luteibaculum oceani]|uniref:M1 family metallopeptidase n=1 Tax=Luteibaculum oceani TaxID=1294296 RepID=A0A5C6UZX5_9FLAO|nr:M1 family metallopeptidase [Luteibaculum oceani]TXC78469.1 M1 family metallopeptidase [Luteibaculum oceani]
MKNLLSLVFVCLISLAVSGQTCYWQQHVKYDMDVVLNEKNHQLSGEQVIDYTNNSPDTINEVFYHLYFNAFQPGSMMDVRSRTIEDPDPRVNDRIAHLDETEIGFQKVLSLFVDGKPAKYQTLGTILQVLLPKPILPGKTAQLKMEFLSQVPVQIRRSGRDNKEGISYSMTQWYPKLAEYDKHGWHPNPYVGREFYGIWGDFDVSITANKNLVIGGTGSLKAKTENKNNTTTWHFEAENVHDFAWAGDFDYIHDTKEGPNGLKIHFYYENEEDLIENWTWVQDKTVELFKIMNSTFGPYPYKSYSILQGGDGGMEYPQATLITGERSKNSLLGVIVHEVIHSWYQMILGTNESLYPWMDEGFTTFASGIVMDQLLERKTFNPHTRSIGGYVRLVESGKQEPLSTHADFFHTNFAYGVSSYSKGSIFLWQLNYMLGDEVFFPAMRSYYNQWKFKHPTDKDFIRVMEKKSGVNLDWYLESWVYTNNTIDYGVKNVEKQTGGSLITLEKVGEMAMPIDVKITLNSGKELFYHISNYHLFSGKGVKRKFMHPEAQILNSIDQSLNPWPWTHPEYQFTVKHNPEDIKIIEIDPFQGTADVDRSNNIYTKKPGVAFKGN